MAVSTSEGAPIQVGDAIAAAMAARGDHALRDSVWGQNLNGTQWEQGYGFTADYLASNAAGNWEVAIRPFEGAPPPGGLIQAFDTTFSALGARSAAVLWAGGYRRAIVGIDYADPGLTQANLQAAAAQGFELEAFAYLVWSGDVAARVQQSIALVAPLGVRRLWLDCEDNGQGASGLPDAMAWPPSRIVELIGQARAACGAFPCGLYSGAWWWVPATGNSEAFADDPWWVAAYDGIPTLTSWGLDFGGIAQPLGKQYAGDVALAGLSVDLSVFAS